MTIEPISTQNAAAWYIAHFGEDLPAGENWYWVQGICYYDEIPETDNYLIASATGLQGIVSGAYFSAAGEGGGK